MKKQLQIADAIAKCIQERELSESELQCIESWCKQGKNDILFKELLQGDGLKEYQNQIRRYNSTDALNKVLAKSKKQQTPRINTYLYRVAAVMVPFFFLAWGTYQWFNQEGIESNLAQVQSQGSVEQAQVVLVLGNGEAVKLDDISSENISEVDGTVISNKDGLIKYDNSNKNDKEVIYNTIKVPRGGEYQLVLADGTKVWLNSDSEIKYPVQFVGNKREVQISGELYFDVSPDKNKPFVITANGVGIEVLGTEFNVKAYHDDEDVVTTLIEGSVKVKTSDNKGFVIKPNDQLVFNKTNRTINITHVNAKNMSLWKEGVFYAEAEPLSEIMERLARWYNVEVVYDSPSVKSKCFSIEIKRYEDISKVLHILEATQKVDFDIKGNKVIVMK